MKTESYQDRKIWITGASSGIGYELAKQLIEEGAKVAVSARNEQKLNELVQLNPNNAISIPFDITDKSQYAMVKQTLMDKFSGLDMMILNAGDCKYIDIKNFNEEIIHYMMHVNFMSMVYAVEAMLPVLRQAKTPHIVAMSSSAAYTGLPRAEGYGTSKAAIKHFFDSLRVDLYKENIPVTVICPGFVKTPLTDKNDFAMPMRISADKAASLMIKGLKKYKREIRVPWMFVGILRFISILPLSLRTKLLSKTAK